MEMHQGGFPGALSSIQLQPAPHPGTGHCRLGTGGHFSGPQQHHNQHAYDGFTGDHSHFGGPGGTPLPLGQGGVRHSFGLAGNIGGMLSVPTATGRYPSPPYVVGSAGFPSPASQGQLAASLQLQKLNTQYYNHQALHPNPAASASAPASAPASAASKGHLYCLQQQELHGGRTGQLAGSKVTTGHHQVSAVLAPPTPSVMDTDLVDEEVLMALVLEMGLDRVQELPELWLGQNEFDFMTEFVYKQQQQQQQPSRISC